MDMQAAIKELQETAIVMAGIQARQAEALKYHSQWLAEHDKSMADHRKRMEHIETTLAEATDRLNGLIVIVDDLVRHRGKQS